jgi:ComF family protein
MSVSSDGRGTRLRRASQRLADLLFPPRCLACETPLESAPSPTLLCARCRGQFVPIATATSCSTCLRPVLRSIARPVSRGISDAVRCAACIVDPPPFERLIAPWRYQPPLSHAILALKFRRLDFLAAALAELAWSRELVVDPEFDLVVPIPLAPLRRLQRGFNQSREIADLLASRLAVPILDALRPAGLGARAQSRLGRLARRAPERRRFAVFRHKRLAGKRILLVDDVVTTGATLRSGAAALVAAGASAVTAFALAATPAHKP